MKFPDYSAQEEIIRTDGDVELLYKRGKKILRCAKKTLSREDDIEGYNLLTPLLKDKNILEVGLGIGIFSKMALGEGATVKTVEISPEIKSIFDLENTTDAKHTVITNDIKEEIKTLEGKYDIILYDISWNESQGAYDLLNTFLDWAITHLSRKGFVLLNSSEHDKDFISERLDFNITKIYNIERHSPAKRAVYLRLEKA